MLYPLLWAYMMDREEVGLFTQVFTPYGARRICWLCLLPTQEFNRPENTPDAVAAQTRTRAHMFEVLRDTPHLCTEYSIHSLPPLAMDVCHSWVLADRFHHMTVVMWRVKSYTEELMQKLGTLDLLDKRFKETPRHRLVKPWPRGIIAVSKV